MGQVSAFNYVSSNSFLNTLDVRYKLLCLSLLSIATLQGSLLVLTLISAILMGSATSLRIKPMPLLTEFKPFFFLLTLVFVSRSITIPGEPVMGLWGIWATRQGILAGALVSWQFLIVMFLGVLFSKSTKPSQVKGAVQWLLKPVPFVPQARVAVMVSLFLRFMPLILKQASEVSQAQQARCSSLQKNPVKRMQNLCVPLVKKTFQSADSLTFAMESRCYRDERTEPMFISSPYDTKALVVCLFIWVGSGLGYWQQFLLWF